MTERPGTSATDRAPKAWICPFLRAIDDDEVLGQPSQAPDATNRCAALREPVPQSLRQQELVCLTSGHVNCPRYLRGSLGMGEPAGTPRHARTATPATVGALAAFVIAFVASVGFVVVNGGLVLSAAASTGSASGHVLAETVTPPPTPAPAATETAPSTPIPTPTPTPSPTPEPTASPGPTPTPSPSPTPAATPEPTTTAEPTPTASAKPTSNRYALLTPCPDASNCYIYSIRSGDNLYSITNYFGVSFDKVKAMNPWTDNGLKVGRGLRIPTPTR